MKTPRPGYQGIIEMQIDLVLFNYYRKANKDGAVRFLAQRLAPYCDAILHQAGKLPESGVLTFEINVKHEENYVV